MRMSRRLALYAAGGGKALCFFCGAVSETLTIQQDGVTVATVSTNAHGITETAVELKKGTYSILGSVSGYEKTGVVIDGDGTYNAYPEGAVFWFGNGDTEGDTLWSKCGGWTAANISYASGNKTKPSLVTDGVLYAQGSISGVGSTSGYYGTVYMNNAVDVIGANKIYISNCRNNYNGSALSRIGVVNGTTIANSYSFHAFADVSSTSYVTTELDVSAISNCIVANGLFAKYYGGNGAVSSRIQAIWTDEEESHSVGGGSGTEQLAGTNIVDVLSETYRYGSDAGDWATAETYSTDNYFGQKTGGLNSALIPVGSFAFSGTSTKLEISLYGYCPSIDFSSNGFRWAICSSNANKDLYKVTTAVTGDSSQLASGIAFIDYNSGKYTTYTISLAATNLPANTPLYVYLWANGTGKGVAHFRGTLTSKLYYR